MLVETPVILEFKACLSADSSRSRSDGITSADMGGTQAVRIAQHVEHADSDRGYVGDLGAV